MGEKGIVSEILKRKSQRPLLKEEKYRHTTITLPEELHRKLKIMAAEEGRSLNELMLELITRGLKERA